MGNDLSMQLRERNLMTKIMLKDQDQIIQHLEQEKIQVNRSINQMGDTLLHYAAYKSLKKLIQYLLTQGADVYAVNHRNLSALDVALPEIRQWFFRKIKQMAKEEQNSKEKSNKLEQRSEVQAIMKKKQSIR